MQAGMEEQFYGSIRFWCIKDDYLLNDYQLKISALRKTIINKKYVFEIKYISYFFKLKFKKL